MRIFTEKTLRDFIIIHPESKVALQEWVKNVKKAEWKCFADIKRTFNSVDAVGNQRFVFNIHGNDYRVILVVRFVMGAVYVRFIGTHSEYDKIRDISNI